MHRLKLSKFFFFFKYKILLEAEYSETVCDEMTYPIVSCYCPVGIASVEDHFGRGSLDRYESIPLD